MVKKIVLVVGFSVLLAFTIVGMVGKTTEDKNKEQEKALSVDILEEDTQEGIEQVLEEDRKKRYTESEYEQEVQGIQDSYESATNNLSAIDKKVIQMTSNKSALFLYDKTSSKFAVNDNASESDLGVLAKNSGTMVSGRTNKGSYTISLLNFRETNIVVKSIYIEDVANGNIPFEYNFDGVLHKNETVDLSTLFDLLPTYDISEVEVSSVVIEIASEDGSLTDKIILASTLE